MSNKSESPGSSQILEELGLSNLPAQWTIVRIEDLLTEQRGISVGVMYPGEHDPLGIPLLKSGDLAGNRINPNPPYRITKLKHEEYQRTELLGGELLLSLVGDIGRCAFVPSRMAGWNVARAIAVLRFQESSDALFVMQSLLSPHIQHLMSAWATTTVQATLNLKEIRQIPLPWPPKQERDRIAHILSSLDDKIENNRRMNETLEAMARALFKDWFVDFGPVRAKMEGREPPGLSSEVAALFPGELDEEGKPRGWEQKPFSTFVNLIGGGTPKTSEPTYWDGDIPWYSVVDAPAPSDIFAIRTQKNISNLGLENSSARLLPVGTTIISARGTVGKLAIVGKPMAMNQSCYGITPADGWTPYFIYFLLEGVLQGLRANTHGSVFDTITRATFDTVKAPFPNQNIAKAFEFACNPWMEQIKSNLFENESLQLARDTLLPKLLSGELRAGDLFNMGKGSK